MKVVAIEPINHDGKAYEPGATLDVTDQQAAGLVRAGAAAYEGEATGGQASEQTPLAPAPDGAVTQPDPTVQPAPPVTDQSPEAYETLSGEPPAPSLEQQIQNDIDQLDSSDNIKIVG